MDHQMLVQESAKAPDSLKSRLQKLAFEKCIPLSVTIEITLKCNLRCLHCYNFDRTEPYPKERVHEELNPPEVLALIDDVAKAGCMSLSFTGGEALVHPHLNDYVQRARSKGMIVNLKSNGALLTAAKAQALAKSGLASANVSIYGGSPETHDPFTLVKGSFERTMQGIRALQDAGIFVRITFCLMKQNAHEVETIRALSEEMGVGILFDPQLTKRYDGTDSSLDYRLDRETLRKLYQGPLQDLVPAPRQNPQASLQCSCARSVCAVTSEGIVYPCIAAPIPSGNIREQSFEEIWKTSPQFQKIRGLTLEDFHTCKLCPKRQYCARSSGVHYANTGDYTGPEEWSCMQAEVYQEHHQQQGTALPPLENK